MKWRSSLVYLVLFLIVGGYFYHFEVVKRAEKEAEKQAAQKVFSFKQEDLQALEISMAGEASVHLARNGVWKIVEPVQTDVDEFAVENYVRALADLSVERQVEAEAQELSPFGLDKPALTVRFQAAGQWMDLSLGDKNPLGDGFYAKTSGSPRLFLVSSGVGEGFFKGPLDLRRKELFSFDPKEIMRLRVQWAEGEPVVVEKVERDGIKFWTAPASPEKRIKASKVDNVLQQLQWLRAVAFLDDEAVNLEGHGLKPPAVVVELEREGQGAIRLTLGRSEKKPQVMTALSSQLPAVVEIEPAIHEDIPRKVTDLEDRSVFTGSAEEVTRVQWALGGMGGQTARDEKGGWVLEGQGDARRPFRDSWVMQSLLWNVKEMEFLQEMGAEEAEKAVLPEKAQSGDFLELRGEKGPLVRLSWVSPAEGASGLYPLRLERDGRVMTVHVEMESLGKIVADLGAAARFLQEP